MTNYAVRESDVLNNLDKSLLCCLDKTTIEKIMNIILESLDCEERIVSKTIIQEKERQLTGDQLRDILEDNL